MPRWKGEPPMTWRAHLRLPDDAAAQLEEIAKQWGVQPAVAARIAVMEWLHRRTHPGEPSDTPDTEASTTDQGPRSGA